MNVLIILGILLTLFILNIMFMIRSDSVYKLRKKILWYDMNLYDKIPSYWVMLFCFWFPLKYIYWENKYK